MRGDLTDRIGRRTFLWITRKQGRMRVLSYLPTFPYRYLRRTRPRTGAWPVWQLVPPEPLRGFAGVRRVSADEEAMARAKPLHTIGSIHKEVYQEIWLALGAIMLPVLPRLLHGARAARADGSAFEAPGPAPSSNGRARSGLGPADLAALVKERGAAVGLSAVGIAAFDWKYRYAESPPPLRGEDTRIITCILEQNYESTQIAPNRAAERSVFHAYGEILDRAAGVAALLREHGYRARVQSPSGSDVAIQYAVASGLGQLGLNGQLLTPYAGSRCRLLLIETDAPLATDAPVDYGIPKICDACQVCVQRCPSGAIPRDRQYHRGVEKAKITLKRCFPVVLQAEGCAVCMRVCPVQKYGLPRIYEEFERSGTIVGKGTDELEAYHWPLDGRVYGPGEKPRLAPEFFDVDGFDGNRTEPVPPGPGWKPIAYISPYKGL